MQIGYKLAPEAAHRARGRPGSLRCFLSWSARVTILARFRGPRHAAAATAGIGTPPSSTSAVAVTVRSLLIAAERTQVTPPETLPAGRPFPGGTVRRRSESTVRSVGGSDMSLPEVTSRQQWLDARRCPASAASCERARRSSTPTRPSPGVPTSSAAPTPSSTRRSPPDAAGGRETNRSAYPGGVLQFARIGS